MLPQPCVEEFRYILNRCTKERRSHGGLSSNMYLRIQKCGLKAHNTLGNNIVCMLVENGNLECAQKTIEEIVHKDVWAWESILNAYISYGCMQSALLLYQKKDEYVRKNEYVSSSGHLDPRTFVALLKS